MGFFDFLKSSTVTAQPEPKPVKTAAIKPVQKAPPVNSPGDPYFQEAKELTQCLYNFPYQAPSGVPLSVRKYQELMTIITDTYQTTRAPDGSTQQTTIDAAERIRLQVEFKKRIYPLLDKCLADDPEHAPAFLLYPRVAEYNTRAKDRHDLIAMFERFLPQVDAVVKGSRGYALIKKDIDGMGGNCFEKVERHLADYHYELAKLYIKADGVEQAKAEYKKSGKLCPKIYGRGTMKIKLL
jgi:hypothetical protein